MTWKNVRAKYLWRVVDERAGDTDLPLLAVSIHHGVVPRSSLTEDQPRADDLSAYKVVRENDLVINRMRAFQGAVGLSPQLGIVSPDYLVLRATDAYPPYLHHLLRSHWMVGEMTARLRGIGSSEQGNVRTPRINAEDLGEIRIPLPSLCEQQRIAGFLDAATSRIDALLEMRFRQLTLFDERLKAARRSIVLSGLDPTTGSGSTRDDWRVAKLGVALLLQRGHDLPADARRPGEVPVVSSGGVSGWHDTAACLPPGVVTGRYGTIGEVFYVHVPYWPLNTTLYVADFRGNDPLWVKDLIASLPLHVDAEKSAVGGINRNIIGDLRVPVPSLAEQRAIARSVADAERIVVSTVERIRRQTALLQERRRALVSAAVTGQLTNAREIAEVAS